jgi:hypothetical protein
MGPAADDMAMTAPTDGPAAPMDVEGRIIGLDRQPLAGVAVSLCLQPCRDVVTGAQGQFAFSGVTPGLYTLRARRAGGDYADLDFPLYLSAGQNPRLLPLVLPRIGASAPLPAGVESFRIDDKLALLLDGGALQLPLGGRAERLAGVRIPTDLFPNFCVPSAQVLAMWAFSPTGITSSGKIAVTLGEPLGLPKGTTVSFIEIDPLDGRPAVAASGAVSEDGKSIQTAMGAGLHRLSWLLLAVLRGGA